MRNHNSLSFNILALLFTNDNYVQMLLLKEFNERNHIINTGFEILFALLTELQYSIEIKVRFVKQLKLLWLPLCQRDVFSLPLLVKIYGLFSEFRSIIEELIMCNLEPTERLSRSLPSLINFLCSLPYEPQTHDSLLQWVFEKCEQSHEILKDLEMSSIFVITQTVNAVRIHVRSSKIDKRTLSAPLRTWIQMIRLSENFEKTNRFWLKQMSSNLLFWKYWVDLVKLDPLCVSLLVNLWTKFDGQEQLLDYIFQEYYTLWQSIMPVLLLTGLDSKDTLVIILKLIELNIGKAKFTRTFLWHLLQDMTSTKFSISRLKRCSEVLEKLLKNVSAIKNQNKKWLIRITNERAWRILDGSSGQKTKSLESILRGLQILSVTHKYGRYEEKSLKLRNFLDEVFKGDPHLKGECIISMKKLKNEDFICIYLM
jgi:hypothetical protein